MLPHNLQGGVLQNSWIRRIHSLRWNRTLSWAGLSHSDCVFIARKEWAGLDGDGSRKAPFLRWPARGMDLGWRHQTIANGLLINPSDVHRRGFSFSKNLLLFPKLFHKSIGNNIELRGSSAVERSPVKRLVAGSNPARGAQCCFLSILFQPAC